MVSVPIKRPSHHTQASLQFLDHGGDLPAGTCLSIPSRMWRPGSPPATLRLVVGNNAVDGSYKDASCRRRVVAPQ